MFGTLLESRPRRERQYRYTIASVITHTAVIGAALAVAGHAESGPDEPDAPAATVIYIPTAQPPHTAGPSAPTGEAGSAAAPSGPQAPVVSDVGIDLTVIPTGLPPVDAEIGGLLTRVRDDLTRRPERGPGGSGTRGGSGAYTTAQVERIAALKTVVEPPYPAAGRAMRMEGRVVVQLVIDSTGRVDLGTVRFTESIGEPFTIAVRSVLPRLRFEPARLDGRPVAQLVEMPFEFRLHD